MIFWNDAWQRVNSYFTVPRGNPPGGRLTLTTGQPVTYLDTTAATVYYTPYASNYIAIWNGVYWQSLVFLETAFACSALASIILSSTSNTISGSPQISGIPSTSALSVGNLVDCANFPNGTTITSIVSSTQVNCSANATATSTIAMRFYYSLYDIFGSLDPNNGLVLSSLGWTNLTARATALALTDGHYTLSTDKTKLYLGTVMLTKAQQGVLFQATDSATWRGVWNYYNRVPRQLFFSSGGGWTWASASWRQAGGNAAAQVAWVMGASEEPVYLQVVNQMNSNIGTAGNVGIGIDNLTNGVADANNETSVGSSSGGIIGVTMSVYQRYVPAGYHYGAWLEYARAGTMTVGNGVLRGA